MKDNTCNFAGTPGDPREKKSDGDEEIGNDLGIGNEDGSAVSDFDTDETMEEISDVSGSSGDDNRSADTGINPLPAEVDPKNTGKNHPLLENADEDELNPYPDELKPDRENRITSTWMMSGLNMMI